MYRLMLYLLITLTALLLFFFYWAEASKIVP